LRQEPQKEDRANSDQQQPNSKEFSPVEITMLKLLWKWREWHSEIENKINLKLMGFAERLTVRDRYISPAVIKKELRKYREKLDEDLRRDSNEGKYVTAGDCRRYQEFLDAFERMNEAGHSYEELHVGIVVDSWKKRVLEAKFLDLDGFIEECAKMDGEIPQKLL